MCFCANVCLRKWKPIKTRMKAHKAFCCFLLDRLYEGYIGSRTGNGRGVPRRKARLRWVYRRTFCFQRTTVPAYYNTTFLGSCREWYGTTRYGARASLCSNTNVERTRLGTMFVFVDRTWEYVVVVVVVVMVVVVVVSIERERDWILGTPPVHVYLVWVVDER